MGGDFLPATPVATAKSQNSNWNVNNANILLGNNEDEGTAFIGGLGQVFAGTVGTASISTALSDSVVKQAYSLFVNGDPTSYNLALAQYPLTSGSNVDNTHVLAYFIRDYFFVSSQRRLIENAQSSKYNIYKYVFSYSAGHGSDFLAHRNVSHTTELSYVFGNVG